jgi:hypothetical protein
MSTDQKPHVSYWHLWTDERGVSRVQALLDHLIERGLDPNACRLFIPAFAGTDGSKALIKVIRKIFGHYMPIRRCQIQGAQHRRAIAQAGNP